MSFPSAIERRRQHNVFGTGLRPLVPPYRTGLEVLFCRKGHCKVVASGEAKDEMVV